MTCRDFTAFLDDYIAGDLPADVVANFDEHVSVCVNCLRYLAQYRDSIALGRAAFDGQDASVPQDVPEDLIAAILSARPRDDASGG